MSLALSLLSIVVSIAISIAVSIAVPNAAGVATGVNHGVNCVFSCNKCKKFLSVCSALFAIVILMSPRGFTSSLVSGVSVDVIVLPHWR